MGCAPELTQTGDGIVPSAASCSYPVRSGNFLRPLIDGEPAFRRICEAIDSAHHSVWATVAFMWESFEMPDGRGTALDVLGRAAARGLDIRLICWRPDKETECFRANAFWGSERHFQRLQACGVGVQIRWDRAQPGFCQHQKSWLIDAGQQTAIAFIGGINLNPHSMVAPGHSGERQNHDIYLELSGPSTVDAHHNFAQRWNEASERHLSGGCWGRSNEDLAFPTAIPDAKGDAVVQIQRTVHSGRYTDGLATPGGAAFNVEAGERSIFEQYLNAITGACRSIYIEHQQISVPEIIHALERALRRGVEIVAVLPAEDPGDLSVLAQYENCTFAGIAGLGADNQRKAVWVHAKLMIVDNVWATIGSGNFHRASLFGNSELNAAFWHPGTAQALRNALFQEHLDLDASHLDDQTSLRLFRRIARENRAKFDSGETGWQGLAFSL